MNGNAPASKRAFSYPQATTWSSTSSASLARSLSFSGATTRVKQPCWTRETRRCSIYVVCVTSVGKNPAFTTPSYLILVPSA